MKIMQPKQLPAANGWAWIKQGYALFMKAPLLWIVLLVIIFFAAIVLSNVPLVGEPLVSLLIPVVLAGLMAGARDLQQGEELELAHLFKGFQRHTTQLVTLGGMALVGQFIIFGVMLMVGGGTLVTLLMSSEPITDPDAMTAALAGAGFAAILGALLFSVLMMAMQFAPVLVYFNGIAPLEAMKLSLRAFLNNMSAMLVYSVTVIALAIFASLPMMLGWLVLMPIVFTSLYASYCDIFPVVTAPPQTVTNDFSPDDQSQF
ncbi:MAG: hypothetical protein HKM00_04500 [Gallionella sp.]|jgi:uncharacterized membrane protein|nr:hypothetical protein [Gallionella sp.]